MVIMLFYIIRLVLILAYRLYYDVPSQYQQLETDPCVGRWVGVGGVRG